MAAFFQACGPELLRMPLSEISAACGVSDATVVRHCRRAGYKGLKDFKIALAHAAKDAPDLGPLTGNEPLPLLTDKLFAGCAQVLGATSQMFQNERLARAVQVIATADNLDAYACGGSVPVASYLRHLLIKLGIRTSVYSDRASMFLSQSRLSKRDAVIAISSSGVTQDIVAAQISAQKTGAITLCLTTHADSPLALATEIPLIVRGGPFLGNGTYSRLAQVAVVDMLYAGLAASGQAEMNP